LDLEASLDDLLDLVDPSLFQEVGGLRDRTSLDLVELVDLHSLGDVRVENILCCNLVTLLADLLLSSDDLILDLEGLAAEFRELLGEVVWWDRDHTKERSHLFGYLGREVQLTGDQVGTLGIQVFVEDDLVHCLCEVDVHLIQESCRVR
jgi:hypothetical protein